MFRVFEIIYEWIMGPSIQSNQQELRNIFIDSEDTHPYLLTPDMVEKGFGCFRLHQN